MCLRERLSGSLLFAQKLPTIIQFFFSSSLVWLLSRDVATKNSQHIHIFAALQIQYTRDVFCWITWIVINYRPACKFATASIKRSFTFHLIFLPKIALKTQSCRFYILPMLRVLFFFFLFRTSNGILILIICV